MNMVLVDSYFQEDYTARGSKMKGGSNLGSSQHMFSMKRE